MQKSEILYEPLPIGRIGVRKEDEEVVVAKDFSCFAHMLEEYICFGAVNIVLPISAPELETLEQMPSLLRKRIRIIDDTNEIEAVQRLLFNVRKEFDVTISEEDFHLTFPRGTPRELIESITKVHSDVKRLAVGFNHGIHIDIEPSEAIKSLHFLRGKVSDSESRLVLSQFEALLKLYSDVSFDAPTLPKGSTPWELISIFDRLVNDVSYLQYSNSVARLASPETRGKAIVELRDIGRGIRSKSYISSGWNFLAKVLKVWTGLPIPESGAIATLVKDKVLPPLVNMANARKQAVEMWKNSELTDAPLRRDGLPVSDEEIKWLPPLDSMKVYAPDDKMLNLGTVGELLEALKSAQELFDNKSDD